MHHRTSIRFLAERQTDARVVVAERRIRIASSALFAGSIVFIDRMEAQCIGKCSEWKVDKSCLTILKLPKE